MRGIGEAAGDAADNAGGFEGQLAQVQHDGDEDVLLGAEEEARVVIGIGRGEAREEALLEKERGGRIGRCEGQGEESGLVDDQGGGEGPAQDRDGTGVAGIVVVGGALNQTEGAVDKWDDGVLAQRGKGPGLELVEG